MMKRFLLRAAQRVRFLFSEIVSAFFHCRTVRQCTAVQIVQTVQAATD